VAAANSLLDRHLKMATEPPVGLRTNIGPADADYEMPSTPINPVIGGEPTISPKPGSAPAEKPGPAPEVAPQPAATPAATPPVAVTPAVAPASAPPAADAYKPVADLAAARRQAFMGNSSSADGMMAVRKLLAKEAGIENFNKGSIADLEKAAMARRQSLGLGAENTEATRAMEIQQNTDTNTPRTAMAPTPGGTPDQPAWAPTALEAVSAPDYSRAFQERSRQIGAASLFRQLEPVDARIQPVVLGKDTQAPNFEAGLAAHAAEGIDAPLTPGTFAALEAGAVNGFGFNERLGDRTKASLGFIDPAKLPPLKQAFGPSIAGAPGAQQYNWSR
jgi:hypothetical protein